MPHTRRFRIADDEAVEVLVDKLLTRSPHQERRRKPLNALNDTSRGYDASSDKERKAFFHGLLTGYGAALKLG